jgi:hypothetical protein
LKQEVRRSEEPLKQVVNRTPRSGFAQQNAARKLPRFKVRARKIGIPSEWLGGSAQDVLDTLDGPLAR